jgi:quercetin dioxygenase-like cupin family protein
MGAEENTHHEKTIHRRRGLRRCRHRHCNACRGTWCRRRVAPHFEQAITNIPGKSLIAVVVDYAPGGASPSHIHAKSAFIFGYVLSGEIESQVDDGPRRVFRAGESFYETPGSRHPVSRNASKTKPAKLLAVFVVDTDDKELTTPVK